MLKIAKRILGIKRNKIDKNDPSLKQYFIDHTVVLSRATEHQEMIQQEYEREKQRRTKTSVRSWEVSAVETGSDESECHDSIRAVVLIRGKAKSASVETEDQGSVLPQSLILQENLEWVMV
jgi:hypothetical protein